MAVERYAKPRDSRDVLSIKELIRAALDAGKSVRQLEQDSGYRVRFQTFQELSRHAPKQFPKRPETIVGMAAALNIPEMTVVLAYATGLGVPINTNSSFALRIPPGADSLDPPLQDAIIQLMRAALTSGGAGRHVTATADKPKKLRVHRKGAGDPSADESAIEDRHENRQ